MVIMIFLACVQSICQLCGVVVNFSHNAFHVFKLVDGILKLFVQYEAICNHNDAVEYNLVILSCRLDR